uniref:Uncharacterized protein n=1 Tax=viral metagenome TaxID=1070528 RepID=A0A6C0DKT2_9ZZZZ
MTNALYISIFYQYKNKTNTNTYTIIYKLCLFLL